MSVPSGEDFLVPAGRTLLLPCSDSSKRKKRWSQRREGGRWETLLTLFRNGTVRAERSRISLRNEALQIQDLQPEDSGEFLCNRKLQARLSVLTGGPVAGIQQLNLHNAIFSEKITQTKADCAQFSKYRRPQCASTVPLIIVFITCITKESIYLPRLQKAPGFYLKHGVRGLFCVLCY